MKTYYTFTPKASDDATCYDDALATLDEFAPSAINDDADDHLIDHMQMVMDEKWGTTFTVEDVEALEHYSGGSKEDLLDDMVKAGWLTSVELS